MSEPSEVLRVGLLGCGTVGSAFVELIGAEATTIEARTGLALEVVRAAVRDVNRPRAGLPPGLELTEDAAALVVAPDVDVVVEVIGGLEPARELVLAALAAGKPVVTANKELLATHGGELFAAADDAGVDLLFEAAVAGGIPIVRPMRESLLGEPIRRVMGIMNGTTNYILTRMTEHGDSYATALADAQLLGFAEADPTADVEGHDAAAKLAILATIAFGYEVTAADVAVEGISGVEDTDIEFARRNAMEVKLLAIGELIPGTDGAAEQVAVRVHPALVPATHPLASVRESFNAVFVEGDAVGELMFYGRGAGGAPTASAVLGDVVDAAVNRRKGSSASLGKLAPGRILPPAELASEYYLHLDVADRPGVLAAVAGVFGDHGVSIRSVVQQDHDDGAALVFVTHVARHADIVATVEELSALDVITEVGSVIRLVAETS
ncbi:MAG: homoserine dehydrogenase [Acidimicrobiia bacterium]|nr:homoserine dehydrogenase [Acidimicrobiia bacterium]